MLTADRCSPPGRPSTARIFCLGGLLLAALLFGGCIRYSVIEPVPHLAATAQSAAELSAQIVAAVDRTLIPRGFVRIPIVPRTNKTTNLLAYYTDHQKIAHDEPDLPSYQINNLTTCVSVMVGDTREARFDLYIAPGNPRTVATVLVFGESDWTVLSSAHHLVKNLRTQVEKVGFQVKTTSKYSGEF